MPNVRLPNRSNVNLSSVLTIIAHKDAVRLVTPTLKGEIVITGPFTHSLAGQFLVNRYPAHLTYGPVFSELYPENTPVIEQVLAAVSEPLSGLGRPFGFSAPCRTHADFSWFLFEGEGFAAFQRLARYCRYMPDYESGLLFVTFNREVYRIAPLNDGTQDKRSALEGLLDQLELHFPSCDVLCQQHHINTFSVYGVEKCLSKFPSHWRIDQRRYHVASIEMVDPEKDADEWDFATALAAIGMPARANFRQEQMPEFEIPELESRRSKEALLARNGASMEISDL